MTTNFPVEDSLKAELMEFLKPASFLSYDNGTPERGWYVLLAFRFAEKKVHALIQPIIEEWMKSGITKMSDLESKQGMDLPQVVTTIQEHVRENLIVSGFYKRCLL
ncbi:hypothetical protein BGX38DRAFT_1146430 [Terfezia claveryi]|nr:hypothetical protein BGX38DRAFT_1146430 [Terfezia claveryi]